MACYSWKRLGLLLLIPLAVLLLVAVACGGDDAMPTSPPTATSPPPTPTTAPAPGVPTPTTAPSATEAPVPPPPLSTEEQARAGAGRGATFVNTPTPLPQAEPTPTTEAMVEEEFPVGARRLVGGILEINYGEPKYGGRLQLQAVLSLNSWDPFDPGLGCFPQGCPHAFSSLLQFNPWTFDRYDIWGDLAQSWEQINAEGTIWEFVIKPHATWWDGTPVTAEDAVYSFQRMTGQTEHHPDAGFEANNFIVPNLDFAAVVDEQTVRIHLLHPWADFLGYMADNLIMMVPKHHYEDLDARAQEDPDLLGDALTAWTNVMGSGPFIPTYVNTKDEWGYDKNPTYWKLDPDRRGLPYVDGIDTFKITDRTAAQAAWEAEQLWDNNIQDNGNMSASAMREMIERFGDRFVAYPAACCPTGVSMNVTKPPFDDPRVRRAIMLAIDRQAHNELVWGGLAVFGTFCGPPGHPLCLTEDEVLALPGWRQPKDQDWAEGRRLLAEAGYENGFATTFISGNVRGDQDEGPVLIQALKNLNIDIEFIVLESAAGREIQAAGSYDLIKTESGAGVITPDQYLNRFFLIEGSTNPFDWRYDGPAIGEPEVDLHALIREQSRTVDPVKRRAILRQIDDIVLTKDTHIAMNYTRTFARLFNADKVAGQQPTASGYIETKAEQLWLVNP